LDPWSGLGARVVWDSRTSESPLSADDVEWRLNYLRTLAQQGRLERIAPLAREDQRTAMELVRSEVPKVVRPLEVAVSTDEGQALSWLGT
jgi:hypothetical protein